MYSRNTAHRENPKTVKIRLLPERALADGSLSETGSVFPVRWDVSQAPRGRCSLFPGYLHWEGKA
jgi:hypothetical protein